MDITIAGIAKLLQDAFHLDQLTSEVVLSIIILIFCVAIE